MPEESAGLTEAKIEAGRLPHKPLTRRGLREVYKKRLEKSREESEIDQLTGLPNKRGFERRLKEEIERYRRTGRTTTVMMFDLDNLKRINDTEGHPAGNEYIKRTAKTLREGLRLTDFVARIRGDEFVAILPETDSAQVWDIWEKRLKPLTAANGISISAGADILNYQNPQASIQNADNAMYVAKRERTKIGSSMSVKEPVKTNG